MTSHQMTGAAARSAGPLQADLAWLGCCLSAAALDAAAGGIASSHAAFAVCAVAPVASERAAARYMPRWSSPSLAPFVWLIAALGLIFAGGAEGGWFATWLAMPAAAAMVRARALPPVLEMLGLTAVAALALGLLGVFAGPSLVGSFGAMGWTSSLAVVVYVALAADAWLEIRRKGAVARRPRGLVPDAMIEASPDVFFRIDPAGRVVSASGGRPGKLFISPETFAGAEFADLFDRSDRPAVRRAFEEVRREGAPQTLVAQSQRGPAEVRFSRGPLLDLTAAVRWAREAERVARLEEERDRAQAALRARTRYFAGMSHELRTPLNAVIGFADIMRTRLFGPMPDKYGEYVDLIHESAQDLVDLVGDILDVSRLEEGKVVLQPSSFDAGEVVRGVARMLAEKARAKNVELSVEAPKAPLEAVADPRAVKQILLNLSSNAVKFTPGGGAVRLGVRREGGDLVLECRDTGPGLSPEEVDKLGQPFEQAEEGARSEERGSGLGLSVVQTLCELHGGRLEIESEPGRGAVFRARIPAHADAEPEAAAG